MEYIGLLAPIAFVLALAAVAQMSTLRKEVANVKQELASIKRQKGIPD